MKICRIIYICAVLSVVGACQKVPDPAGSTPRSLDLRATAPIPEKVEEQHLEPQFGIYRPSNGTFAMRYSLSSGFGELAVSFGREDDFPLIGDWDGNGTATVGVYRPSELTFYLRNSNAAGYADQVIRLGSAGAIPVIGDWDGNGTVTVGVFDPSNAVFTLLNAHSDKEAPLLVNFGKSTDWPVAGDWDGDGKVTVGTFRNGAFYLRNSNTSGDRKSTRLNSSHSSPSRMPSSA